MENIIKIEELRIGNYVKSLVNNEEFSIVDEIGHKGTLGYYVSLNNQSSYVWLQHNDRDLVLPIPLTEEWLLRMGGRKLNQIDWEISIRGIKFKCRFNKKWYSSIGEIYLSDKIQYVHTLQNLIHALTGQELTIE